MAKDNVLEFDIAAAANNSDIGGINILGTAPVSNFDNAFRELMLDIGTAITRHVTKAVGSYTALKADHNQLWRATGAVTINLTAAATLTTGWALWVKADGGAVTVDPSGAETINGAATLALADGTGAFIVCTGTAFFAIVVAAGNVSGPASATDNAVARYDAATGKIIQNSGVIIDDSNNVSGVGTLAVSGAFRTTSRVIGGDGTGVLSLRPDSASATGQVTVGTTGQLTATSRIIGGDGSGVLSVRPNTASTTGQMTIDTSGNIIINGTLTVTG